jgi:hypothetical protein
MKKIFTVVVCKRFSPTRYSLLTTHLQVRRQKEPKLSMKEWLVYFCQAILAMWKQVRILIV